MNLLRSENLDCVADTGPDVIGRQVGIIIPPDIIEGDSLIEQFQDINYSDPCARDTRLAEMDVRVDLDVFVYDFASMRFWYAFHSPALYTIKQEGV